MTDVIPFSFEGARVRVVTRDGDPWFVLVDVCRFLSLTNSSTAARRLDDDERHTLNTEEGIADRRAQQITIVSESGLYSLIMTSRRPEAKRFKKWVTSEVLPEIRKRGSYGSRPADAVAMLSDPDTLRALLLDYSGRVKALEAEKAVMQPKVEALDRIAGADGHLTITEAAKALQMRPKDLFAYLRQKGWPPDPQGDDDHPGRR
jgi:prophage antirepressor-like protein